MDPGHRPAQSAARRAAACNAHDVDAWPARVHEEAVFTAPCGRQLLPETSGVRRGKAAIRASWNTGLARASRPMRPGRCGIRRRRCPGHRLHLQGVRVNEVPHVSGG
ncbi:nuclear transport factor 2 family protein [Stenotrophomonas sp. Y-13]|uniref:nuclear transport factor 2 family protein n=1 Tax=Stenotrophomonas TaxID=40323 RepID=UPI0039171C19